MGMENTSDQTAISIKYLFVLVVLMGILLTIGGFYFYSWGKKAITKTKHEEIKAIAELKIGQITQWHQERAADVLVFSHSPFISPKINQWLNNRNDILLEKEIISGISLIKNSYDYENIFLCSANGELLISFNPGDNTIESGTRLKISTALKSNQIIFTDFYYCPTHKKIHYDIIAPVVDLGHSPIAALVFRIDPTKYLYPFLQSWPTPSKSSETLIVRKDGDSVLFVNELRLKRNTALKLREPLTETKIPAVQAVLGFKGVFEGTDYRGVKVLAYIAPIPETPWFMVAKVDHREAFSELRFKAVYISLFTFVLVVLVGFGFIMIFNTRQKNIYQKLLEKEKLLRAYQEEYKTTLYSIGDAVITTNVNGIIQQMNPVAEHLTGWHETVVKGISIDRVFRIINEETRKVVENPVSQVLKAGLIIGLANHTLLISKSGKEIPIADSGAPIKNESGEITGVVLVFRDQTEEHKKMNELIEAKENFRAIFKNNAAAIAIIEPNTTISMVNESYCRMSGYAEDEVIGMSWTQQIPPDDLERLKAFNRLRLSNPKDAPDKYEFKFYKKDGEVRYALISISMIKNTQKVIASFIDVTESKQAEELVQKTSTELQLIFKNMLNAFIIWESVFDEKGKYVSFRFGYLNDAYAHIAGVERELVMGKDVFEVWPGTEQSWVETYGAVAMTGIPKTFDMYHTPTNAWYHCNAYRPSESKTQVCVMFEDITEIRQAEEVLQKTEQRFRNTLDNMMEGCQIIDYDWRYLYINDAVTKHGRTEKKEMLGRTMMEVYPGIEKTDMYTSLQRCMNDRITEHLVNKFDYPDGTYAWFELSIQAVPEGVFILSFDITERKQAEDALHESETHYQILADSGQALIWTSGLDKKCNYFNQTWLNFTGRTLEQELGDGWTENVHPDDLQQCIAIYVDAFDRHEKFSMEYRIRHVSGDYRWILDDGTPRYSSDGEFIGYIGHCLDITEHKQDMEKIKHFNEDLELRVLERTSQLQSVNAELEAFSNSVSHDLRAPLRHIGGYVELLRKHFPDSLPERGKHYLQTIVESVSQMGMLIDDLLQFSRTGRQELQRNTIEMNKVVEEVMNSNKQDWAKRNIQWIIPDLPQVFGDFNLLKMVWINLISNAVKFTRKIDIAIIEIGFRDEKNEFIFYVRDNGVGFNMQYVDKLFGVFQRLHATQDYEGTGIGLANVRRIILRHGGRTWAEGEQNVGATFYFTLSK
jgi:PAS domain S-box-containing protein